MTEGTRVAPMPWFVRGDIDGFFGLALDNFVQLLLIGGLCRFVLGFPPELLYGRVLPGAAISLLVGNLFYAWQARQLSIRTGRQDICAIPYGINTPSVIAHVFLIMLPAKTYALKTLGLPEAEAVKIAWHAGLVACLGSALIESVGSFFAETIRKSTPRAALLSTLAGIALTFISLGFLFRTFAHPLIGLTTVGVVLLTYFGRVRFKGAIPGGLVAVALGTAIAWIVGLAPVGKAPETGLTFLPPIPVFGDLLEALRGPYLTTYLSIIIPMGVFNVVGSLQNIESAEAAGDSYATCPSLLVNGIGSFAAACFGSCFPTTIYIGHPGWKAMGARAGYSILNGVVITLLCVTGALAWVAHWVPIEAGMAIVLWIGIVISAQAFQAVPANHAPAVVVGLLPGIAAWGALVAKFGLQVGGLGTDERPFTPAILDGFNRFDIWANGMFALEQGFIFTAMILSATTVHIVERQFCRAALWCLAAAGLCMLGLMHSYKIAQADTVISLTPATKWALGYAAMAGLLFLAQWVTEPSEGH